jgi:hypothetical protein
MDYGISDNLAFAFELVTLDLPIPAACRTHLPGREIIFSTSSAVGAYEIVPVRDLSPEP